MLGVFGPKSGKIGLYKGAFIYQGPFKEDFCAGSPAINEVVLEEEFYDFAFWVFCEVRRILIPRTPVNKGKKERKGGPERYAPALPLV